MTDTRRCFWVPEGDDLYQAYHDREWGRPTDDDRRLFEKMTLESFQSGLSWRTILGKRENFRRAFAEFDWTVVGSWGEADVARLLGDAGIVRHRGKIEAALSNARVLPRIRDEFGSLAAFVWSFEPHPDARPPEFSAAALRTLSKTPESTAMSRELKRRGWLFFGPTTSYAFMQAAGIVNDHVVDCDCREACERARTGFVRPATGG